MAGKLILLPLRVWLRSARLLTRAAGGAAERAASLAGQTIGVVSPDRPGPQPPPADFEPPPADFEPPDEPHEEPARAPASVSAVTPARPPRPEPVVPQEQTPHVPEPVHVSEEPELVRESAERGAEEGAGATVTVIEPWSGYRHMNAREVIARARQANPAELAAVRLYESRHRARQTVLAAVDRQLKLGNGAEPA